VHCMTPNPVNIWDQELPEIKINREELVKNSERYRIGSVRLAMGRVCTQEEFDEAKQKIINKPLP
jgi:hypothetical protein